MNCFTLISRLAALLCFSVFPIASAASAGAGASSADAFTILRATSCQKPELTLFACELGGGQRVALCASPDATRTTGYVRYAFGSASRTELAMPSVKAPPGERFMRTRMSYPSGSGALVYTVENSGYRYRLEQTWSARDGRAAGGRLGVENANGRVVFDRSCLSLDERQQEALDEPPYAMPDDPLLSEGPAPQKNVRSDARRFEYDGRWVELRGGRCVEAPGRDTECVGAMQLTVDADSPPIELTALLLNREAPLALGPITGTLNQRAPSIVLADFNEDGSGDVAVAVDRQGGYGRSAYAIHLRDGGRWRYSEAFSAMTRARMGLPIREGGWLVARGKSGCCIHVDERYRIENGLPRLVQTWTERARQDGDVKVEVFLGEPIAETKTWASANAPACPAGDFQMFLRAFASAKDDSVRRLWTRDPLEVEGPAYLELGDERPADTVVREVMGRERLESFIYRWYPEQGRFGWEDGAPLPSAAIDPVVVERGEVFEVKLGRETEQDTYTFKPHERCWQLVRRRDWRD